MELFIFLLNDAQTLDHDQVQHKVQHEGKIWEEDTLDNVALCLWPDEVNEGSNCFLLEDLNAIC